MTHQLYRHQSDGIAWLRSPGRAKFLWDEQGLGKTVQVLVAIASDPPVLPHLVVCPSSVLFNWAHEASKWAPGLRVQVLTRGSDVIADGTDLVVAPYSLVRSPRVYRQLVAREWATLVCDEAHYLKNPSAIRTQAVLGRPHLDRPTERIERHCARCWLLSGTPMPNDPTELFTPIRSLAPEALRVGGSYLSRAAYISRYCETEWTRFGNGVRVVGAKNTEDLRTRLAPYVLRRRKDEVLDLPPVRWAAVVVPVDYSAHPELAELESEMASGLPATSDPEQVMAAMLDHVEYPRWRRLCGVAKATGVADLVAEDLDSDRGKKIVVMAHHTDVIQVLRDRLDRFGALTITGSTSASQRSDRVRLFQGPTSHRVLIGQITAAGVGITLTSASDLVFAEMSYSPGDNAQAADRIHRIGQTRSCLVRCAFAHGSVDQRVAEILARKSHMIQQVVQ